MKVQGYQLKFSCKDGEQYIKIGEFWDNMSNLFGRGNLFGVGYGWQSDTILYLIGHQKEDVRVAEKQIKQMYSDIEYIEVNLPDEGWLTYVGRTEQLALLYDEIYKQGSLDYEIEYFSDGGECRILVYRE